MSTIKIGIVEDEMIIADRISVALEQLGYTPLEPAISYTEALEMIGRDKPDILLLDIMLAGSKDGIELAQRVKEEYNLPFIFLTANSDAATVERAKKTCPSAYLVKPFSKDELYASIEICLHNHAAVKQNKEPSEKGNYIIDDCLFVKQGAVFLKIRVDDITHMESDRVYVNIYAGKRKLLVRSTLQSYLEIINSRNFIRTHRSYAVNALHIESVNAELVTVAGFEIPVGKAYRNELLSVLRLG